MTYEQLDDDAIAKAMFLIALKSTVIGGLFTLGITWSIAHHFGLSGGLVICSIILWYILTRAFSSSYSDEMVYDLYERFEGDSE